MLQALVRTDSTIPRSLSAHNNCVRARRRVTSAALNFSVSHKASPMRSMRNACAGAGHQPPVRNLAVINEADPRGRDNQETADAIAEIEGVELATVSLIRRKAFPNAAAAGLSVSEYGDDKAKDEFFRLTESIVSISNPYRGVIK